MKCSKFEERGFSHLVQAGVDGRSNSSKGVTHLYPPKSWTVRRACGGGRDLGERIFRHGRRSALAHCQGYLACAH